MKINTSIHQVQKQLLAPAMQQSIETLLLPLTELNASIDLELQENPLLEIDEERQKVIREQQMDDILKSMESVRSVYSGAIQDFAIDDEKVESNPVTTIVSLEEQLLQQLRIELSDPLEIRIGELIIGSLDEDGYLKSTPEEIAWAAGINDTVRVEYILTVIQNFEPVGIASRDLKECLRAQIPLTCNGKSALVNTIIDHHLEALGRKKFQDIAKALDVSLEDVKEAARLIAMMEPKPARNYRPINSGLYIKPDVFIEKDENDRYSVRISQEGNRPLRINARYQQLLKSDRLSQEEKTFIREKLKNALFFIKSIEQRGRTIERITEYILNKQKDFFEQGHMFLVPMSLKDVAQAIDRNESTISRAITNKYVATPTGLFPLKFFFSVGISENETGAVASRSIKEEIKDLIESEDKASPLSDQSIQDHFKRKNVNIARRTISKYRQNLRILPSHLRKN